MPLQEAVKSRKGEPSPQEIKDEKLYKKIGLTLKEYEQAITHLDGRLPNWTEVGIYSVMWSEHCSYKSSKVLLGRFPTKGSHVIQGPGEGAGIIDIGDNQAVVFKMESHNHPSAIEPFQGAATGVGGIIRDIISMGARPIAILNSLRFGEIDSPRVPYLLKGVVAGISHYGNCMGIPTVGGEVFFNHSYEGNPLVNVMCVGLLDQGDIQKGVAKGVNNPVIYVGASTGRDGIHGATFASHELDESSEANRPQVQVGDPFMEKLLLEACMEMVEKKLLIGIQDMGAAGLTCSSTEMAAKGGVGLEINLDLVPRREEDMTPYEILLSESQERMLLVVKKGVESQVEKICDKWGLPFAVIGTVTEGNRYRVYFKEEMVADIPVDSLVDSAPVNTRENYVEHVEKVGGEIVLHINPQEALYKLLSSPNIGSKEWVYKQYDYMVQASTRITPGSDSAVIFLRDTKKAIAVTTDGNSRYVYLDPEKGGMIAVSEAARNVVCSGARPLGITNCLNFGSPEKSEVYYHLKESIEGIRKACEVFKTPVIGGNVSLYNETSKSSIYPTPIIGMVGLIEKEEFITTHGFKEEGDAIYLLGETFSELGGSELQAIVTGQIKGDPPKIDLAYEFALQQAVLEGIRNGLVCSAHDLSEGGFGVALIESCIEGEKSVSIQLKTELSPLNYLFSESQSRILLSTSPMNEMKLVKIMKKYGLHFKRVGEVQSKEEEIEVVVNGQIQIQSSLRELSSVYKEAIPCKMNFYSTN